MINNFQAYSRYYDLLNAGKDYKGEASYVLNKLRSQKPDLKDLLELGCGTGNHATFFSEAGLEVTGIEISADMVELAQAKQIKGFRPIIGNITSFDLSRTYDSAIALFHVISYLTTNNEVTGCLQSINRHLNIGGCFVFDVWYAAAVFSQQPTIRIRRLQDQEVEVMRVAEPEWHKNRNVVDVNYQIQVKSKTTLITETIVEKHSMRYFSIPEIELLASTNGFKLVEAEEFLTGKLPSNDTWGVCILLQKEHNV